MGGSSSKNQLDDQNIIRKSQEQNDQLQEENNRLKEEIEKNKKEIQQLKEIIKNNIRDNNDNDNIKQNNNQNIPNIFNSYSIFANNNNSNYYDNVIPNQGNGELTNIIFNLITNSQIIVCPKNTNLTEVLNKLVVLTKNQELKNSSKYHYSLNTKDITKYFFDGNHFVQDLVNESKSTNISINITSSQSLS